MEKLIILAKRRSDMSRDDFTAYYENTHKLLIANVPHVRHYVRRYLEPATLVGRPPKHPDGAFDVLTEVWFDSQDDLRSAQAAMGQPEVLQAIIDDEHMLFDPRAARVFIISSEREG
jgi:uncharacterized protein (TIGR02118 family)